MNIYCRNVNDAYWQGRGLMRNKGIVVQSRNGPTLAVPYPVLTQYAVPEERVLFDEERDANPFFHLYEALWMLEGRNDVASLAHYVKRMEKFSDDGISFHGAYGFRWRYGFGFDQLALVIESLRIDPNDRRVVMAMWSPVGDMVTDSKDIPCNTHIYFRIVQDRLVTTVCCRSNDMVWGAYGANAVHFSILHEYVARHLGVGIGQLHQLSNNLHVYVHMAEKYLPPKSTEASADGAPQDRLPPNPYLPRFGGGEPLATVHPLMSIKPQLWDGELEGYMAGVETGLTDPFFTDIAIPYKQAYDKYKLEELEEAIGVLDRSAADPSVDWLVAGKRWLRRRIERQAAVKAKE